MGVYIWNKLPSEYQEVEWIGRNGNNYIDTGWIPTTNFTIKAGYKIDDSGYRYVLLSNYGGGTTSHSISLEINSGDISTNKVRFYCGTTSVTQFYSSNSLNINSFNDITITAPGTINLNGTTTTGSMYSGSYDSKSCYLFMIRDTAASNWSTFSHNPFISYCKIYEGSTLVRDFVPCYRKSDNVIGLYDLVNNQFYTNAGTGTFTKGSDVNNYYEKELQNAYIGERNPFIDYQEVEYIQSSGTQYIDTGYILTSNPGFDIDFAFLGGDSNSWIPICGARNNPANPYGTSGFCCLYINSNSKYVTPNYAGFDPGTSSGLTITNGVKYNMVQNGGQFYVDGVYKSSCSTTNTYTSVFGRNFLLFANNDTTGTAQIRNCQMKLFGFKLYNNGTLVRDFVPCYRISDSVIGLYDLVNDVFYTNSGSGTFSKGADV